MPLYAIQIPFECSVLRVSVCSELGLSGDIVAMSRCLAVLLAGNMDIFVLTQFLCALHKKKPRAIVHRIFMTIDVHTYFR